MKTQKRKALTLTIAGILLFSLAQSSYAGTRAILSGGKTKITDGIENVAVDSNNRIEATQHPHVDQGNIHFDITGLAASTNFILIDLSDLTNYPHVSLDYVHIEALRIEVDAAAAANYEIEFAFLENVDATNSDIYVFTHTKGTQQTGKDINIDVYTYPNGQRCRAQNLASHDIRLNDTTFQTDVNQKTTLDPSTADTPSGEHDVVMLVIITAGQIDLVVDMSYHSH